LVKVAYVTMQFPQPSETFASNEVRLLSRRGIEITVYGLRREHPRAEELVRERGLGEIPTTHNGLRESAWGALAALARPWLLLRATAWVLWSTRRKPRDAVLSLMLLPRSFGVLAAIEQARPDVVHMYWGHFPTIVGYLVQRRLPATVTSVSIVAYDLEREYGGAIRVARNANVIRTHAEVNVPRIAGFVGVAPDRVEVIYNGVDIAWVEQIRRRHRKVRHRVVTVGRLSERKGMSDVIKAFAHVHAKWPDATLTVVGDSPERAVYEALAASLQVTDAVRFLGHVAHTRVIEEVAKAEVFVLLSRSPGERLPNVVKEGMACRSVCVTTPTTGIAELVDNEVTGFIVPMSDPVAAGDAVDAVFAGRVNVPELTRRAHEHIVRAFDLNRTAVRYEQLWRAALEPDAHSGEPRGDQALP
jgi:colanic acid/amylovoran biosynthesis glycosyltransferase